MLSLNKIVPLYGFCKHSIKSTTVVFPDPEGPVKITLSDFLKEKLIFSKINFQPGYLNEIFLKRIFLNSI